MALLKLDAWRIAARPHTLPAAIVPVLVGSGLAYRDGAMRIDALSWALLGALALQIAANFANDVSDARRGADSPDRTGPPRMVALGVITAKSMWVATWIAIGIATVAGIALTFIAGPVVIVIGVASVLALLGYVGGPIPYGYRGLGEPFVFVFFGLVATVGSRFVHDASAPAPAWLLAVPVGMLVTAILVANNYRDIETDRAVGKRTLAVILGRERTRRLYMTLVIAPFVLLAAYPLSGGAPTGSLLALAAVPLAIGPVRIMASADDGPSLVRALKLTARLHLAAGVLLALGVAVV